MEFLHRIDNFLGVGGFDAIDPGVLGIHVNKEKTTPENLQILAVPKDDVHMDLFK